MAFGKNKSEKKPKGPRLPLGKFLAWKGSDVSIAGLNIIINTYMTLYCTDFLGLSGTTVAMILLISNIVDGITDLIAAYVVDNTNPRWGKGRTYELGIIGVWICTLLMFSTPGQWSEGLKIAWVFCMYTFIWGVFNTFRGAASMTYAIRAFDNDRTLIGKVYSYGGVVTIMGSMVVSMTFPVMMGRLATSLEGWRTLVAIYTVPLLLIGLLRFVFVKENPAVDAGKPQEKVRVKDIFRMLTKNKYVWFYGIAILMFNAIQNIGVLSYYFKYIVGSTDAMGIFSAMSFSLLPVMFIFPQLMKKFSVSQIMAGGSVLAVIGYAVNFVAGGNVGLLMGGGVLTSLAMLPMSYLGAVILMDLCTYNEYKGLPRMEASTNILSNNFMSQLGQGIGGAILGIGLDMSGYITGMGDELVAQPESAIAMIRNLYSTVPMVMVFVMAIFLFLVSKMQKQMPEIDKELASRKATQVSEE